MAMHALSSPVEGQIAPRSTTHHNPPPTIATSLLLISPTSSTGHGHGHGHSQKEERAIQGIQPHFQLALHALKIRLPTRRLRLGKIDTTR